MSNDDYTHTQYPPNTHANTITHTHTHTHINTQIFICEIKQSFCY